MRLVRTSTQSIHPSTGNAVAPWSKRSPQNHFPTRYVNPYLKTLFSEHAHTYTAPPSSRAAVQTTGQSHGGELGRPSATISQSEKRDTASSTRARPDSVHASDNHSRSLSNQFDHGMGVLGIDRARNFGTRRHMHNHKIGSGGKCKHISHKNRKNHTNMLSFASATQYWTVVVRRYRSKIKQVWCHVCFSLQTGLQSVD